MSKKEIKQISIFQRLKRKEISQKMAALLLSLSTRQVRRKIKKFQKGGAATLIHKNRGRSGRMQLTPDQQERVIALIQERYYDFGPTFAAEKLQEIDGIIINRETLRQFMIKFGLWSKKRRRRRTRHMRPRREFYGELVQIDGSEHDWFQGRAPRCTLIKFIDDATSKILWAEFASNESYDSVMGATMRYFYKHGKPHALYSDCGKTFRVNNKNEEGELLTQYEYALKQLGVGLIHAYSPQAKGRIERSFGTDQDRLVKEMRLAGINSIEQANTFLIESYIFKHNKRYAHPTLQAHDLHQAIGTTNLEDVFCIRKERVVRNDWTVQCAGRIFQIEQQQQVIVRPKEKVTICKRLDGSIFMETRGKRLAFSMVGARPAQFLHDKPTKTSSWPKIPPQNHPWRRTNALFFK